MGHEHHGHTPDKLSAAEAIALLKYMAQHNTHHAEELQDAAAALCAPAAARIAEAIDLLQQSTEQILLAIRETEG